jgi:N-methylhydantoinase A
MRTAHFSSTQVTQVPVFRRAALDPGAIFDGPAIIEEKTFTVVLYPGQHAETDGYLNIEIKPSGRR